MTSGQWLTPESGASWFYDAGSLSLDYAHTGALAPDAGREQLTTPEALTAWLAERSERLDPATGPRELDDALLLRAAITRIATGFATGGDPDADDIDTINLFAAMPDIPPALSGGRRQAGAGRIRLTQALSHIARDAVRVFEKERHDPRIRSCAADDCALVFLDESRTGSRRWCSMQRCGNRAKVRAHRARTVSPD